MSLDGLGDIVKVISDIGAPLGEKIILDKVMCVGGSDFTLFGRPLLPHGMVSVEATVVEKTLSRTKISQVFRRRENFKKTYFTREKWSLLRINDISINREVD